MIDDIMNFDLPQNKSSIIKVIGVGGGGSNAVNHMFRLGIRDVDFVICNTDAQALVKSPIAVKIQLGKSLTEGRGAGNKPQIGKQAALENLQDVMEVLSHNTKMIFITAGMGGGTGTGGAPVIAKAAREKGILTVGIVTIPFRFEGNMRYEQAITGLNELKENVDSLLVINNEKLREIHGDLKLSDAFAKADNVLASAAKGIAEIITVPGYVNVDFADVETIMSNSGVAIMGSGTGQGEGRALDAIREALSSPLLNDNDITGADNILLNITSGMDEISMDEVGEITDYVNNSAAKTTNLIWGTSYDDSLGDKITVTIIATGFKPSTIPELDVKKKRTDKIPLVDSKQSINKGNSTMKMHEKTEYNVVGRTSSSQRVIEFDLSGTDGHTSMKNHSPAIKDQNENTTVTGKKNYQDKEKGYTISDPKNDIDQLENEPAFVRKKLTISDVKHSEDVNISKYSLQDGEDNKAILKKDNPYLHDNVD